MKVFVEIPSNHYQYGTLGRSREALESMTCDCQYDPGQSSRLSFSLSGSVSVWVGRSVVSAGVGRLVLTAVRLLRRLWAVQA